MAMDTKDIIRTESVLTAPINDGNGGFNQSTNAQTKRTKSYQDIGSNSLGKVEPQGTRPCAIIGPDRILPPPPTSDVYLKKASVEPWSCSENIYRSQTDFAPKLPEYQQVRNISPRQAFQENMQRIMMPPTYNSNKNVEDPNLKGSKDAPLEVKYCEVPYPVNQTNNGQKSIRNPDIPMTSVNPAFTRTVPPHGWPNSVSARPVRPFGAPEYYQYPEFANYTHPRTIPRPLRTAHHDPAQVSAEHLYHEGNVRFKPYPTLKDRYPQARYEYGNGYPNQCHPHGPFPTQKFDLPKNVPPHPYPMYSQVPMRRIAEPMLDSYQRSNQPANFNPYHNQYIPPPYGPIPGNCIPNKMYPHPAELPNKPVTSGKLPYDINNKIYLDYENNINKMYPPIENMYYRDLTRQHLSKPDVAMPIHPGISMQYNVPPQYLYRKDNMPMKPFDNISYRSIDPNIHGNSPLSRHPMQYPSSGLVISPAESNASNETLTTVGNLQEDCGYVSQSSTTSGRSMDSGNYRLQSEMLRKHESFYNSNNARKYSKHVTRSDNSDKKGLDVRQFLQMWNEGEEEPATDSNIVSTNHFGTNSETISNQEQLYVLGLVNIPNEELSKYEHIQKISKLPENIKGYNSIEILDQYEQLVESPAHKQSKMNNLLDYQVSPKAVVKPSPQVPRPVSPLDVEAKISQSVIHKEVGCNFEIKPCSPKMLNAEVATPAQNIIDERAIEKVMNLGLTNSSIHSSNTENITSCKMNSPYISNSDAMKSNNYSFQELESNSGICLASLPRLDSDIELSFPEINQQFIDANRFNSSTNCDNVGIASPNIPSNDVIECNVEKESSKLSKYRKNKAQDPHDDRVHPSVVNRTDSVIIKNPDNIRNQEEVITSITTIANENMENHSNIGYHDVGEETDIALDFSLNKITENDKNESECITLPDLNAGNDLQENYKTNVIDSNDSTKSKEVSNDNNEEINNHGPEYGYTLCSLSKCNSESISDQKDPIYAPTEPNTKNDNYIFLNEHIDKNDEDHLKSIEEEVENIKLQLPSLCENSIVYTNEIQQFSSNGNNEDVNKIKHTETIHESSKHSSKVIEVTSSFTTENNSFSTNQDVCEKISLNEILVGNKFLEEHNAPKQCAKNIINNEQLKNKSLHTIEANAIDIFSCVNETKKELAALANKTLDHFIVTKYENGCPSGNVDRFESRNTDEYNGTQHVDLFVEKHIVPSENEVTTETSVVAEVNCVPDYVQTNKSTLDCDGITAININNHSVNVEENLKQETLPETENECIDFSHNNKEVARLSPIAIDDTMVTSSACASIIDNLITESPCDVDVLEENMNKNTQANTINEVLEAADIEREPFKLEPDSQENISSQMLEIQDFIEEIKADMSSPIMDIEPDYEFIPNIDDEINIYTNNNGVPRIQKYFYKEYYSPRLRNLFLYHEGICSSIVKTDSTFERTINMKSKNEEEPLETSTVSITENTIQNSVIISSNDTKHSEKVDDIQALERSYVVEADSCEEFEKLDNSLFQETEILYIHQDEFSHQSSNKDTPIENSNSEKNNIAQLNRRLTLKRSLSDSAIDLYNGTGGSKEQLEVNRQILSKRQKIIPHEALDRESEKFCSIVQNNRRNSISFCNSQNVYILIDNEYVIEEGDEDSEKVCFTEVSAEFCRETDPVLNVCVTNDTEEDLIHEINTPDCLETSDQSFENETVRDAWDMNCVETIFNDDVAQDIIISAPTSPENFSLEPNDEEESVNSDSENEHMVRIREIYGNAMCTGDVQLVETLYNTPQMDVNKTLVDIESQNIQETLEDPLNFEETRSPAQSFNSNNNPSINEKENDNQSVEVECNISNQNEINNCNKLNPHEYTYNDCVVDSGDFRNTEYVAYNNKENDLSDSLPSSPEVSSTTSEEKCSSILLKITSVNGSRTSQINNVADNSNRISYKLTEVEDYSANYRPLITKAAKKYIPPLKESQDLRVKLPLPQQSLDKLKRLKMAKNKPAVENTTHRTNHIRHDIPKKIKPKFEDVLRSIDEIQFKMKREKTKKIKSSIPKVVIKKSENGAHYASTPDRKPNFNPDLTGRKWQPWVFIERNEFVDKMALRNKVKAVYCHRKKTYVLAEKFKKYKSICTAKFVISQPNSDSASTGNLKYTIKLKHNY